MSVSVTVLMRKCLLLLTLITEKHVQDHPWHASRCNSSVTYSRISGVSLAYPYESFDTPRSEPYFVRATYVPRTCDVPVTFPRMKCMRDVSTAYVLRSRIICCISDLYQLLFNTYQNKRLCSL